MKQIILTNEEYDILIDELQSLWSYHWNSERIHADDCGSKILGIIEDRVKEISYNSITLEDSVDCRPL